MLHHTTARVYSPSPLWMTLEWTSPSRSQGGGGGRDSATSFFPPQHKLKPHRAQLGESVFRMARWANLQPPTPPLHDNKPKDTQQHASTTFNRNVWILIFLPTNQAYSPSNHLCRGIHGCAHCSLTHSCDDR